MSVARDPIAARRRRAWWEGLNTFVTTNGGWITSRPNVWPIEMQCPPLSELPAKLEALGYGLANMGTTERVTSFGPSEVLLFHLDMPHA